ncbi:hypothetical protein COO60DRAFT_414289 [Scenedesmus sp. NREL 46B-D3]|nr:hypothetical protein COO60DRAFT_414289 [Scenedesmus sp. NREL 46B-D3]
MQRVLLQQQLVAVVMSRSTVLPTGIAASAAAAVTAAEHKKPAQASSSRAPGYQVTVRHGCRLVLWELRSRRSTSLILHSLARHVQAVRVVREVQQCCLWSASASGPLHGAAARSYWRPASAFVASCMQAVCSTPIHLRLLPWPASRRWLAACYACRFCMGAFALICVPACAARSTTCTKSFEGDGVLLWLVAATRGALHVHGCRATYSRSAFPPLSV